MKRFIHLAAVAAAFAFCINAPAEGAQPVTTSVQIPLAGTVFVPLCDGPTDAVSLSGMVHVVGAIYTPRSHIEPVPLPHQPRPGFRHWRYIGAALQHQRLG